MGKLRNYFLNHYPRTDFHELNQDWMISMLFDMINQVENFVEMNAVKYADPIQWDITRQYEKNTIVVDAITGTAYISSKPVPMGVALSRTEYWSVIFDLSRFITLASQNFANSYEAVLTTTATMPTDRDKWVVWNSILYRAKNDIHVGDRYVVDGNIEKYTVEMFFDELAHLIAEETEARIEADNVLHGEIVDESVARENADDVLQGNIDAVQDNVDAEATARENADATLQDNIDAEVTARQNADTDLNDKIELEISNRVIADTDLNNKIELEITNRHTDDELLNSGLVFFRNKKIAIFGDSLSDETVMAPNWVARLRTATASLNCTIDNYSVGGMGICSNLPNSGGVIDIIDGVTTLDYDFIIIMIGVNDRNNKIAFGASGDINRTTFYGGINEMYSHINSKFGNTPVYYVSIPQVSYLNNDPTYPPLNGYRAIIQHCCNHYGWNKIDVTTRLPYYTPNATNWADISDGLHVKPSYSQILMKTIVKQISDGGVDCIAPMPEVINYDSSISGLTGNMQLITDTDGTVAMGVYFTNIDVGIQGTQVIVNTQFPFNLFEIVIASDNAVKSIYPYPNTLHVNLPSKSTWAGTSPKYSLLSPYRYNN